jgi:hypothetical protein
MTPDWPHNQIKTLEYLVAQLEANVNRQDILGSLRCLGSMQEHMVQTTISIIEIAGETTRIPQSQLAGAAGIPPSALRGLRTARA